VNKRAGLLLTCSVLAGCISFSKPYPSKSLHGLHLGDPPASASPAGRAIIRVERAEIVEPFDGSAFVYRVGESTFTGDYYNGFVARPANLLTAELSAFLARSGVFSAVVSGDSVAEHRLALETRVTSMYGDYRPGRKPEAVVAAHFFVLDQAGGRSTVLFDRDYSLVTSIEQEGPGALIRAWETGWTRLLGQLVTDLSDAPQVVNPADDEPRGS